MKKISRVFLCGTFTDLSKERKRVLDAIRKLQLQHDSMEFFGASGRLPIKTCLEEVRKSDILVVVVGHRYGNLVPGRGVSFSEAEYREGHRLGKPCLVYIRDETVRVLPKHVERDPEKVRRLEKWKATLSRRHTTRAFSSLNDLAVQVTADISRNIENLNQREEGRSPEISKPEIKTKQSVAVPDISSVVADAGNFRVAMADLERSYDITLQALGDSLDLKNAETEGHSRRVTAFTIALARGMGLAGDPIRVIARGAFLHDIGKQAIPGSILRKPGPLTAEETDIMREHCFRGYQMLRKIPFLSEAAEIVYSHQEKFDGSGYPRGLKGNEIPIGARIFAVADTIDAITTDRPYRAAQTLDLARKEVVRLSGHQFDPEIVRVFLQMPETIWEDLRRDIDSQTYRFTFPIRNQSETSANLYRGRELHDILTELKAQRIALDQRIRRVEDMIQKGNGNA